MNDIAQYTYRWVPGNASWLHTLCYKHVWELRMQGYTLIPVVRHERGIMCDECMAEHERNYYDALNESVARVGGG